MIYYSGVFTHLLLMSCAMFYATNASCSSSQFTCNNGNCKPLSSKCDNYDDCGDNSDEFGCGSCSSYQFRCYNGLQCIDATLACNGVYNCSDGSDESRCTYTCPNGAVRLVGTGSNQASGYGRVEMCYNNAWGTICGSSWSYNAATVVCSQLGFSGVSSYSYAKYGQGTGSIFLYGLSCYGSESSLYYCFYSGSVVTTSCSHSQDASVTCYGSTSTQYYYYSGSYTSSSSVGIGIGVSVFVLVFIVVVVLAVVRVYARQAIIRRGLQTRVVTNAPAATTIVTTTTQNSTPQTAGFDPLKGYTGYAGYVPPPSYPATGSTGYPTTGYPATGYPTTGYPATGYPATGYPTTGSTGYSAPGYTPGYPGAPPPYPS